MSAQHTRGPWFISKPHQTIYIESRIAGGMIQEVASIGPNANGWSESKANARLIAAAPELLEALLAVDVLFGHLATDSTQRIWLDNARSAINKATNPD